MHRFYYDGDGPDDEDGNPGGISFLAVPSGVHNYSHGVPMDIWDGGIRFEPDSQFVIMSSSQSVKGTTMSRSRGTVLRKVVVNS